MGILVAAIARNAGARSEVITDINPCRLDLAARLAYIRPVDVSQQDLRDIAASERIIEGLGVVAEFSGARLAIALAVGALKMGGCLFYDRIPIMTNAGRPD